MMEIHKQREVLLHHYTVVMAGGEVIEIQIIKSPSLGKRATKHKQARTELITP